MARTAWPDRRIDDLARRMDAGFARVDGRFDALDARLDAFNARLTAVLLTMVRLAGALVVCLLTVIIALGLGS